MASVNATGRRSAVLRLAGLIMLGGLLAAACSSKKAAVKTTPTPTGTASATQAAPPPPVCPLTGAAPASGSVPNRPALGIKVPNDPTARPQTGLDASDIVYEEPVEGGITRLLVIYQCSDAARIEPVRSARFVDIDVLEQFGKPIFANAGGIGPVLDKIKTTPFLINAEYSLPGYVNDYHRDSARAAPNNLYTSTTEIYATAGASAGGPPTPIFTFGSVPAGSPTSTVHAPFSGPDYDVYWRWDAASGTYHRFIGTRPSNLSTGAQISAKNVVVQQVSVTPSQYIEDNTGTHENLIGTVGTGPAIVCSSSKCVTGTWSRPSLTDITKYLDASGAQIALTPGNTWVELEPNTQKPAAS